MCDSTQCADGPEKEDLGIDEACNTHSTEQRPDYNTAHQPDISPSNQDKPERDDEPAEAQQSDADPVDVRVLAVDDLVAGEYAELSYRAARGWREREVGEVGGIRQTNQRQRHHCPDENVPIHCGSAYTTRYAIVRPLRGLTDISIGVLQH